MNWTELQEYYEKYDTPEYVGFLNSEIYLLKEKKRKLELTPEQLRELAIINEKLEYLRTIKSRSSASSPTDPSSSRSMTG